MATRNISTKLAVEGESEYRASITRINSELKAMQSALKLTESQYQTNANSMEALKAKGDALKAVYDTQKKKVDELRSALANSKQAQQEWADKITSTKQKIAENEAALEKLKKATGDTTAEQKRMTEEGAKLKEQLAREEAGFAAAERGTNNWKTQLDSAQIQLNNIDAEIQKNSGYMAEAQKSADGCATSIDKFGREVNESADQTSKQNEALEALASVLAAGGIAAGVDKITDALKECVSASADFEHSMSGVGAIANASADEMDLLTAKAKEIGATTKFTAGEAAEALQYMALAGWNSSEMLSGVDGVISLAAASGEDLASVSDIVTDALTAFGLSASDTNHFVDILAKTSASSNTNVAMLGEAFKYAAPLAGALGYSVEDVAVAMGLMANNGIKGSQAGTTLRTMFTKLSGEVTLSGKAFGEVTVSAANSDGTMKSFSETLEELRGYFNQMTDAEKLANAEAVAGKYAMSGLTALMNTTQEDFDSLTSAIQDCSGAASTMATVRMDNLTGQVTLMKSAFDALKIAVGDDLNPALRKLSENGTDVLTWATNFVETHEAAVPVIASVVAGLTTLTGGVALFTLGTKVVTPLVTAFNAALAANPAALIAIAVGTLIATIVTFNSLLAKESIPTVGDFTEAAGKLSTSMESIRGDYEKAATDTEATAQQAEHYVQVLRNLEAAGLDSTEAQEAYRQTVEKLNSILPDLNLTIDEQTGLVVGGTDAIYAQIQAWRELAIQEALTAQYKDTLAAVAAVEAEQYSNRVALNKAEAEGLAIADELAEKEARRVELEAEMDKILDDGLFWTKEGHKQYNALADEYEIVADACDDLNYQLEQNLALQETLSTAIEIGSSAIAEQQAVIDDAEEALHLFNQEHEETASAGVAVAAVANEITDSINEIAQAYRNSYDECRNSLEGQIGLFDKFMWTVDENADTAAEMLEIWSAQAQNIANYGENLKKALEYGLDERLIRQLSDGSADSAGYLATIITEIEKAQRGREGAMAGSAEGAVAQFNEAFAKTEEAKDSAAVTMAAINSEVAEQLAILEQQAAEVDFQGFWDAVDAAFSGVFEDFRTVGNDSGNGIIAGINDKRGEIYAAMFSAVRYGMTGAKAGADTNSPSRITRKIFHDVGEGMIVGIKEKEDEVKEATQSVAAAAVRFDSGEVARLAASVSAAVPDYSSLLGNLHSGYQESSKEARTVHIEAPITINAKEGQDTRELAREVGYVLAEMMDSKGG